jgi:hypothetical protein
MALKFIEVKTSQLFVIDTSHYPKHWTVKHIIEKEWFSPSTRFINISHAGRDGARVGNSKKLLGWKELSEKELEQYVKEIGNLELREKKQRDDTMKAFFPIAPPDECIIGEIPV